MMNPLLLLLAAHSLGDFFLQPDALVQRKQRFGYLLLHASIHAALAWVALRAWGLWQLPLYVLVLHLAIDFVKQRSSDSAAAFLVDQVAHVASLVVLVGWADRSGWPLHAAGGPISQGLVLVGGFVATVYGAGFYVGKIIERISAENEGLSLKGLANGGKWIGQLERALIFLLVLLGQPAGVGFLVAAKSILRFEEAKDQKTAEYILIGTLLSFFLAIAVASGTRWAVGRF